MVNSARPQPQLKQCLVAMLPRGDFDVAEPNWLVGPVGQHRDSEPLEESNFSVLCDAMTELDPDGLDHEVLDFAHWAVGWIEELATRPGSACASLATDFRSRLAEYPILDEEHLAQLKAFYDTGSDNDGPAAEDNDTLAEIEAM